jgi:RNA polymerase sigma factor (sigma-70 family)
MRTSFLDSVLRGAEALAGRNGVGTLADPDLLRRFAADRDEAAFAVLVRRHGPLVWGVCRNLLPADADAEDAFQATFVALVRSAGTIRRTEALGAWLHGVAYRVAMKARRGAARRKRREAAAAVPEPDTPVSDATWDELQAAVHDEVCRLPEKLRLPFVLCGLQGRPQRDAAELLGWKVGTVSGRLTQARQRLLDRLARRGVPVGVAAGATVLGITAGGAAVPASIFAKAMAVARAPGAVSPVVLSLARGVSQMSVTRTKLIVAGVLMAGALTTGLGSRVLSTADAQAPPGHRETEADVIKRALDYLAAQQTQDRWEYKFVPAEKGLTAADLQKLLSAHDRDGWEYCGAQDLAAGGRTVAHLTFKRPRHAAADADVRKSAAAALLAELAARQDAKGGATQQLKLAEYEKFYRAALHDAEAARKAEMDAKKRADDHEVSRAVLEKQLSNLKARMAALADDKNNAEIERNRADQVEQMLKKAAAEQEALTARLKELEVDRAKLIDKLKSMERSGAGAGSGPVIEVIQLKNVDSKAAVEALTKMIPEAGGKIADVGPHAIAVYGNRDDVAKLKETIAKIVDRAASSTQPGDGKAAPPAEQHETMTFKLQYSKAADVQAVLAKVFDKKPLKFTTDASTNSLFVQAPADVLAEVKKVIAALDVPKGERY